MRRKWCLLAAGVGLFILGAIVIASQALSGRKGGGLALPEPSKAAADVLPVRKVVLFNSGVGYFQREGEVSDDSRVEMQFATSDINDLLKSMVLEDLGGGKVNVVNYDSNDPLDKILHSFALDLTGNPTFGELLNQARGEKVEVTLEATQNAPPAKIIGNIIGMEVRAKVKDIASLSVEMLNLHTKAGIKSINLNHVSQVRFLNAGLENEFQQALQVLASLHDVRKKRVSLGFKGAGKRKVRVGYVVERPIWKMTYRLRLEKDNKLYLQGWALVENTSDYDWNNINMVLVSGKPISFKMNLYDPLYVPRPTVEPELFASLRPPLYQSSLYGNKGKQGQGGQQIPPGGVPGGFQMAGGFGGGGFNNAGMNMMGMMGMGGGFNPGFLNFNPGHLNPGGFQPGQFGGQPGFPGASPPGKNKYQEPKGGKGGENGKKLTYDELQKRRQELQKAKKDAQKLGEKIAGLNFKEGIESVATAEEIGDYFQYRLDQKVSISRRRSAMLPVFNTTIKGEKVSIYNRSVHNRYPLLGLRFKNSSGHPLTQGPITVYDEHSYAGDTRILDVQPNEERLLSYAMDLKVKVFADSTTSASPNMTFKIGSDQLQARYNQRKKTTYLIVNRSSKDRTMIVEHPFTKGWDLVDPAKASEKTNEVYRFEINVPKNKTTKFYVVEEQPRTELVSLTATGARSPYFAVTPETLVFVKERIVPGPKMTFKIGTNHMTARYNSLKTTTYLFENHSKETQKLTLEYPVVKGWELLEPQPKERKEDLYRFSLKVPKDEVVKFEMVEQAPMVDELALLTAGKLAPFYSVAAGIAVKPVVKTSDPELVDVKIVKGKLHVRHKVKERRIYYVQNASDQKRTFTLDHIVRPDWSLIDPNGKKHTGPEVYRYEVEVPADKTGMQKINEEKISLADKTTVKAASISTLKTYLNSPTVSKQVKKALAKTLELHDARLETEHKIAKTEKELERLNKDQARLRDNLKIIPMNAEPYKKFLDKFVKQEVQIESLQQRFRELNATLEKQNKEYEQYVANLNTR